MVVGCGGEKNRLQIDGSFKGLNQGELYIYGMDGTHKLDTIGFAKGEFHYQIPLEDTLCLVLVFPNFSELPIFATPGAKIKIEGDASHLKETKITGTKDNEELTAFRLKTSQLAPPEVLRSVAQFIRKSPASPASRYMFGKYFIQAPQPDYQQACELAEVIQKAEPNDPQLPLLIQRLKGLSGLKEGAQLPAFTAKDVEGHTVGRSDLNGKVNIITVWSTWNYESKNIQNQLQRILRLTDLDKEVRVLSICIDANAKECRRQVERDSVPWSTVCDGRMWETPLLTTLGLSYVPDNIIADSQGKIIGYNLNFSELRKKMDELRGK